ncbi:hypothetical protein GCM10017712_21240 [Curtobacterium citreum]
MFQLVVGAILVLWGAFVVAFPRPVIKLALAAEKAGLAWNPQARWGTAWVRLLGVMLCIGGLLTLGAELFGIPAR